MTSATKELATSFSTQSRDCFAEWGPALFDQSIRTDIHAKDHWETTAGGSVRAIGAGSSVFGRGADLIVIDDYFGDIHQSLSEAERKAIHQWYYGTIRNRLEPGGSVVVVASRTNADDLNGKLWKDSQAGGETWKRYCLQAIGSDGSALWPQRWPLSALETLRDGYTASGFPWIWDWLFQQDGPDVLDSEWSSDYFRDMFYTSLPDEIIWRSVTLDPSVGESEKGDFSAIIMLAVDRAMNLYIEADIARRDIDRMTKDTLDWYQRWGARQLGVETVGFQKVLRGHFEREATRRRMIVNVAGITHPKGGGKRGRLIATLTPQLAQHRIQLCPHSAGCRLLLEQLKGFPTCKYDDGPDALEMAITLAAKAVNAISAGNPLGPPKMAEIHEMPRVRT